MATVMKFVLGHLQGRTIASLCSELGLPHARVRSWFERGRIPKEFLEPVAKALKVSTKDLLKAGFEAAVSRKHQKPKRSQNIVPIAKVLTEIGVKNFSLDQFVAITEAISRMTDSGLNVSDEVIRTLIRAQKEK